MKMKTMFSLVLLVFATIAISIASPGLDHDRSSPPDIEIVDNAVVFSDAIYLNTDQPIFQDESPGGLFMVTDLTKDVEVPDRSGHFIYSVSFFLAKNPFISAATCFTDISDTRYSKYEVHRPSFMHWLHRLSASRLCIHLKDHSS